MSKQPGGQIERRWTGRVFTGGTTVAGLLLLTGIALQLLGGEHAGGNPLDAGQILDALVGLRPWGWSMLGVIVLLLTPPLALLATFAELRRARYTVSAWLAIVVLAILALAVLIALR